MTFLSISSRSEYTAGRAAAYVKKNYKDFIHTPTKGNTCIANTEILFMTHSEVDLSDIENRLKSFLKSHNWLAHLCTRQFDQVVSTLDRRDECMPKDVAAMILEYERDFKINRILS